MAAQGAAFVFSEENVQTDCGTNMYNNDKVSNIIAKGGFWGYNQDAQQKGVDFFWHRNR